MHRAAFDPRTELLGLSLKLKTGSAFALASDQAALIEGAHADHLLYLFDEAKSIPSAIFDAAEGAFSGAVAKTTHEAFAMVTSTPGEPVGRFYDIHRRAPGLEDWWTRHVTMDETIAAGRMAVEWADQRKLQWGTSAVYKNRVLGEFAASDVTGIIALAWVEAANERWRAWKEQGGTLAILDTIGVDVAVGGEDATVMAPKHGDVVEELRVSTQADTMVATGVVVGLLQRGGVAIIDVIGAGAGPYHRLKEQHCRVLPFNAAAAC